MKTIFRTPHIVVAIVSAILLIYCFLVVSGNMAAYLIFALSPFLLVWMVYTVIRYGNYKEKELAENEEWGYEDKRRDELSVF